MIPELRREDTPERFARLSACLFPSLSVENEAPVQLTLAEQKLAWNRRQQELHQLSKESRDLAPLARKANAQLDKALSIAESAPGVSGLVMAGAELAIGYSLASRDLLESGSKGALAEISGAVNRYKEITNLHTSFEAAKVALYEQAPRFCAAPASGEVIACTLTEEKPFILNRILDGDVHSMDGTQTLTLANASGHELTDCVIQIRLIENDGQSYLHHYYVKTWPAGQRRRVVYSTTSLFDETSKDVNRLEAQLFAREFSSQTVRLTRSGEAWPYTR
jgi:hypothetical protein